MALRYIEHYHVPLGFQYMYHNIHFISLLYGLLIDVKYVKIIWIDTIRGCSEFENLNFFICFLNTDISLIGWKFPTHADEGHLEGRASQNFDLGPTFYSMQSRKKLLSSVTLLVLFYH